MPGAVDQRDLKLRVAGPGFSPWQRHDETGEAQVKRYAALAALRLLVEGGGGGRSAQRARQRCLAAVDVTQHAHIHIHPPARHAAAASHAAA